MNHHFFRSMAICVVAAGAFALSSGCASSPEAGETVASMDTFGVEVVKVKDSIDHALKSLDALVASQPSDIRGNFDTYSSSVTGLDHQANVVRERADEMKKMGDEFFKEWEPPEHVTPERRAALSASYDKIKEDMTLAKEEFTPFLNSLKDIEGYLKLDLSPHGINSMGELSKKARENGTKVKSSIDAVLVQVNSVRGMIPTK
jgi:Protein of unknown function (DUF2959)